MSRLRRIENRDRIFFVTTNLAKKTAQLRPLERDLILKQIGRQHTNAQFLIFAYVVMPDHLHLLLSPLSRDLIAIMREFKACSGQSILKMRNVNGPLWQPRYFDFILRRVADFGKKAEYIHHNPVEANLVSKPADWLWSSATEQPHICVDSPTFSSEPTAWLYPAPWRKP